MDREVRLAATAQMVAHMQAGQSWHKAATNAGFHTSRAPAYRLLRRVRTEGAVALDDQRHGHPTKVRQPVRDWLAAFCRAAPGPPDALSRRPSLSGSALKSASARSIASARLWM